MILASSGGLATADFAALTAGLAVVLIMLGILEGRQHGLLDHVDEEHVEWRPGADAHIILRILGAITQRLGTRSHIVAEMLHHENSSTAKLERELNQAGRPWGISAAQLRTFSIVGGAVVTAGAVYVFLALGFDWWLGILVGIVAAMAPRAAVGAKARERVRRIKAGVPGMLDLLVLSAEAGGTPRAGLRLVAEHMTGVLAEEVAIIERRIGVGVDEETALMELAARTGITELEEMALNITTAVKFQAMQYHEALEAQAERLRISQRQESQRLIHAMNIKMLFPIMCYLVAMMLVILGPSMLVFTRSV